MLSILTKLTGGGRTRIMIRPDSDSVFLSGCGDEAQGQYLRGKVDLFVGRGDKVQGAHLSMVGYSWFRDHSAEADSAQWKRETIYTHHWAPFLAQSTINDKLSEGVHEWPFELFIPGSQQQSMRGCDRCQISYRLEASLIREGFVSNKVCNFTPISIHRCPPMSAFELMDSCTIQGEWAAKVEFSVSIAHQAIALGGLIPVQVHVAKLESDVGVKNVKLYLHEIHTIHTTEPPTSLVYQGHRKVSDWMLTPMEQNEQMRSWDQCLPLPKIVKKCAPDFNTRGIAISHALHFSATLVDAKGAESEYEVPMPINLFVSPELPVNGWGVFNQDIEKCPSEAARTLSQGIHIPPKYNKIDENMREHMLSLDPPPPYTWCAT